MLIRFTVIFMFEHAKLTRALSFEIRRILEILFHWSHQCCLFFWSFDAICQREDKLRFYLLTLNAVKLNQIAIISQDVSWTISRIHLLLRSLFHQRIDALFLIYNYEFTDSMKTRYSKQRKKISVENWIYYKKKNVNEKINWRQRKKKIWQTVF